MSHARRANQSSGWLETTVRFGGDAVLKQMYAKEKTGYLRTAGAPIVLGLGRML
ncbi:MAG: hypothetical protein ABSF96_08450 [Steroidobacteraceae bacterium]|jgi:hypothetical protein